MGTQSSISRRLATNSVMMYIRMIFVMALNVYMSRVLLKALGVEDYGTYNVVGSMVAAFDSIRSMFVSSSQRYLNYEMVNGNDASQKKVFCVSVIVNLCLALLLVSALEGVGSYFIGNHINVDASRISACLWVLQFSVLTTIVVLISIPYEAAIVAHEKMGFYAFVSILDAALKLCVAYMIQFATFDQLIFYAMLLFCEAVFIRSLNIIYAKWHFKECHFKFIWDTQLFKKMVSFSGWNFLGSSSYAVSQNGMNMVLNMFAGSVANAARGIAYQVYAVTIQLVNNVSLVVYPQCTKFFASGNIAKLYQLIFGSSKFLFEMQMFFTLLLVTFCSEVLTLWLGEYPPYTIIFVDLILFDALIRSLHSPIDMLFKSHALMKWYQIAESIVYLLPLGVAYVLLSQGFHCSYAFICLLVFDVVDMVVIVLLSKRQMNFPIWRYIKSVMLPCLLQIGMLLGYYYVVTCVVELTFWQKVVSVVIFMVVLVLHFFFLFLDAEERNMLLKLVKRR